MASPDKETINEEQPVVEPEAVDDLDVEDFDVMGGRGSLYGRTHDIGQC